MPALPPEAFGSWAPAFAGEHSGGAARSRGGWATRPPRS